VLSLLTFLTFTIHNNSIIYKEVYLTTVRTHQSKLKIYYIFLILFLFIFSLTIDARYLSSKNNELFLLNNKIDVKYIYNITENLSNIIFTEYDEENGEIAKGRAFGSKGEHKAAEILFENFTILGLNAKLEPINERPGRSYDENAYKLEVLDYYIKLDGKKIDCYVAPSWHGLHGDCYNLDTTFNFKEIKIVPLPKLPCWFNPKLAMQNEDFMFITNDQWNSPNYSLPFTDLLKPYIDPLKLYMKFHVRSLFNIQRYTAFWYTFYPKCRGLIMYDFNKDCHDMIYFGGPYKNRLPVVYINGSDGDRILDNIENLKIDLYLKQSFNKSIVSYNVIGQLNGTDSSKTFVLSSLYDSWWCQGTADSAIGVGVVMAIAKYYVEHDIIPKYNMKFILFSGEEYDIRGAIYYEANHSDERIEYILDLNQIGFTQNEPRLTLDIVGNKKQFLDEVWNVAERTDYAERTGDTTDIKTLLWSSGRIPSNPNAFAVKRPYCKALSLFKNGGWILHHRDGLNHTEGDVLKYFNWTDVAVTGEIVLNITKHFTIEIEDNIEKIEEVSNKDLIATDNNYKTLSINTGPIKAMYSSRGISLFLISRFCPFCRITI
jgi:hypothetical protein